MKRSGIKRGSSLLRRSPLAAVSKKRAKLNRERTEALRPLREEIRYCQRCGVTGVGLDAHELLRRSQGGSLTDVEGIRLICRACHIWIGNNVDAAEAEGWAVKRWAA